MGGLKGKTVGVIGPIVEKQMFFFPRPLAPVGSKIVLARTGPIVESLLLMTVYVLYSCVDLCVHHIKRIYSTLRITLSKEADINSCSWRNKHAHISICRRTR